LECWRGTRAWLSVWGTDQNFKWQWSKIVELSKSNL
jgi:hypothetical protein